ncbi:hypothetical protein ACQKGO_24020 [Corallococcus interemptor]|uniref:hypothetical protein n=1 Tax=Corallococcus interemptor TaxID=2316720 RepID=UPI003D0320A5
MFGSIGREAPPEAVDVIKKSLKDRFSGHRVVSLGTAKTDEEREVISAINALQQEVHSKIDIDPTAWDRAVVKMGLGLACLYLGEEFAKSPHAARLRSFLWEEDPEKRDAISLHGSVGILAQDEIKLSPLLHTQERVHIFCLSEMGGKIAFLASLFGKYDNFLEIDGTGTFSECLPGTLLRGVGWIVDPGNKETTGPVPLEELMRQRIEAQRLASERDFALRSQSPKDTLNEDP